MFDTSLPPTFAATSPTPAGGEGGAGAGLPAERASAKTSLLSMLRQGVPSEPSEPPVELPPPAAASASPEPTPPAAGDAPGQPTLPADNEPPAEPEPTEPPASATNEPPSTPASDPEAAQIAEAIGALSPAEKAAALEVFKNERGKLPRLFKVLADVHTKDALIEKLSAENETLKAEVQSPESKVQSPQSLPPSVARLRTMEQIAARQAEAETEVDTLETFLDTNSGDADTVYDRTTGQAVQMEADGKRYYTRAQLVSWKQASKAELRALPKHAAQIEQTAALKRSQAQIASFLAEKFPKLKDPESPVTQLYQAALKAYEFHPNGPMIAFKLARGHAIVEGELAAANGKGTPLFGTPPRTPAGKVPVRQAAPSGGGGGAPHTPLVPALKVPKADEVMDRSSFVKILAARRGAPE